MMLPRALCIVLLLVTLAGLGVAAIADAPTPPEVSQFAPAEDLLAQVKIYVAAYEEALATSEAYAEKAERLKKDAHTLAVLALTLGLHDKENELKPHAAAVIAAARSLASAADYTAAKTEFANLQTALSGLGGTGGELKWEKVASLGQLMKQVTFVNNRLRRGMRRFEAKAEENARDAAVLAVIAQAAIFDTHEVKDPADVDKWYQFCGEMRDSAAMLNARIKAADKQGAESALAALTKSCDSCHEAFRVKTDP